MKKDVFAVVVAIFVVCASYYDAVSFGVSPVWAATVAVMASLAVVAVVMVVVVVAIGITANIKFRWFALLYLAEIVYIATAISGADKSLLLASLGVFYGLSVLPKKVVRVAKKVPQQEEQAATV